MAFAAHAGTGTHARIPDHRHAQELRRRLARRAPGPRTRGAAALSRQAPLVRAEGPETQRGADRLATSQPQGDMALVEIETDTPSGTARWLLPLAIAWEDETTAALAGQLALARVRHGAPRRPADRRLRDARTRARRDARARPGPRGRNRRRNDPVRANVTHARDQRATGCRAQLAVGGTIQFLAHRRRPGDGEDVPPHLQRPAPGSRDGPLPHRATVSPIRRRCWARWCGSKPTARATRWRSRKVSFATRATPGAGRSIC